MIDAALSSGGLAFASHMQPLSLMGRDALGHVLVVPGVVHLYDLAARAGATGSAGIADAAGASLLEGLVIAHIAD